MDSYYTSLSQLACPPCSDFTIVIPFNTSEKRFDRGVYSPLMTGGRATLQEIETVLNRLELLISNITSSVAMIVTAFLLIILPAFGVGYFSVYVDDYGFLLLWIGFLIYILIVIVVLVNWRRSNLAEARSEAVQLIQTYQPAFQAKGLRWHIPMAFPLWIELYKEYREMPGFPQYPPIIQPPVIQQLGNQGGYPMVNLGQGGYQPPAVNQPGNQINNRV